MRKTLRRIGLFGLASMLAIAMAVTGVFITHRRNEDAFLAYVATYGNYNGRKVSAPPPSDVLIKAGDRACDWLKHRPVALWRTDERYRINSLSAVYRAAMSKADRAMPKAFLPGAWRDLCPATVEFIKPHDVFGRTNSD